MSILIEPLSIKNVSDFAAIDDGNSWELSSLQAEIERSWAYLWGIRTSKQEPAAYLVTWLVQDELHILYIVTALPFRQQGYARALLEYAFAFAHQQKVQTVWLEVRGSNQAAFQLYRRFGFEIFNVRKGYYRDGEDALEMKLVL